MTSEARGVTDDPTRIAQTLAAFDAAVARSPGFADWPGVVAAARSAIETAPRLATDLASGALLPNEAAVWYLWSACRDKVLAVYEAAGSPVEADAVADLAAIASGLVDELEDMRFFDDDEAEVARQELHPPRIFPLRRTE